jgi:hypothetical protein
MKKDNSDRQYLLMKPKPLRFQGNLIVDSLGLDFLPTGYFAHANVYSYARENFHSRMKKGKPSP